MVSSRSVVAQHIYLGKDSMPRAPKDLTDVRLLSQSQTSDVSVLIKKYSEYCIGALTRIDLT